MNTTKRVLFTVAIVLAFVSGVGSVFAAQHYANQSVAQCQKTSDDCDAKIRILEIVFNGY